MLKTDSAKHLHPLLVELRTHLTKLLDLLNQEHTALAKNDTEQVAQLAQQKQQLTTLIEHSESQRRTFFASLNLSADTKGMAQLAQSIARPQVRELAKLWQEILQTSQTCQQQNQINGIVLAHQQRRAMLLLQILRGQTNQTTLYSARGNKESEFAQHSLARI